MMTAGNTEQIHSTCRLCEGQLSTRFNLTILNKYDVKYYQCEKCRSLQTENPFWLGESYAQNLSNLDTGAAQRNIHNLAACYAISKLFKVKNALDIGGGDGLLCRFLRDYGINCFVQDKYAQPTYAQGFTEPDFKTPDLVIAFEVIEHFSNPKADLDALFHYNANVLLLSTAVYTEQQNDWWYLTPESGQHIFFYSKTALDFIAAHYNYTLIINGGFILFVKSNFLTLGQSVLAKFLLNKYICRLLRAFVVLLPTPNVWKDHLFQKEQTKTISRKFD
jgi:hypothetical protein